MIKIIKIAWKDLKLLSRDYFGLFWLLVFPLIFAVVFGTIFASGQQGHYTFSVIVVDDASSPRAEWFAEQLKEKTDLSISKGSLSKAKSAVHSDQATAYLQLIESDRNDSLLPFDRIEIGIDQSRSAELSYLKGLLTRILLQEKPDADGSDSTGTEPSQDREKLFDVHSLSGPHSTSSPSTPFAVSFPQAILWGLLACVAGFATSLVSERTAGTFLRLRMAPVHPLQLLFGKALACFLTCATVILVLSIVGVLFFNITISSVPVFLLALLSSSLCFVGLMMFISTLGHTERAVGGSGWAIMAIMAMFGGGMVPLFTMPGWMKAVSDFSPVKWSIFAIEGALWRHLSIPEVLTPVLVLVAFGTLFFLAGLYNFYRIMKR